MRRIVIAIVIVVVLAIGGWFVYQRFVLPAQSQAQAPAYETVPVARGTIASTVSATGNFDPKQQVSLLFRANGPIAKVPVAVGDVVVAGQLLAELDTTDQTLALAQAKVSLEIAEDQLKKLVAPPDIGDIAAAQAALEVAQAGVAGAEAALSSAQATYRDLLTGPNATQQVINESQLRQAEISLKQAQEAYDKIKDRPDAGLQPQAAQLEQATVDYEVAKAQVAKTEESATQAEIAQALNQIAQAQSGIRQAQAQVVNARNSLDTLLEGATQEDINISSAQVRQAQLSLLQAENALANARIVAPFDGVVSQVNVKEGEIVPAGVPAVEVTDLSNFIMKVLVDEIDVREIAVGQPVRLSIDALPDSEITGKITKISPTASDINGTIAYEVTVVPDPTDAALRAGMSATAIITTASVDDAILLPNRFIQLDRETDRAYVYKMVDGEPVLQEVELGLRNERQSQILAGLSEGDEVALVTQSAEEQLRGALFGGD